MIPLQQGHYYHIYNRANGDEQLFLNPENYRFFLRKYMLHIKPVCNTLCYCLMPNHFHLLIQMKELEGTPKKFSKKFSNLFSSYTQAFNKQNGRMGGLFMKPYKRKEVSDEIYLKKLIHYIHHNPVAAGLCEKPKDWEFSSYRYLIAENETFLEKTEVLNYFDDLENFKCIHSRAPYRLP